MNERSQQLEYSELQPEMHNEAGRRRKAAKMQAVLRHFAGDGVLEGARVVDLGCSTGFIADEFRHAGAKVAGVDIDVPGLAAAKRRFADGIGFLCADGEQLPLPPASIDVVVFNHIYEHVVDADAVMTEIDRILAPDGVAYLGFGNKWGVIEPHYGLPFLSWLPPGAADRYVRAVGKGEAYHERFRGEAGLRRMAGAFTVWDYTESVLADPAAFAAGDVVSGSLGKLPPTVWRLARPLIPTFIWVAAKSAGTPAGPSLRRPPRQLFTPA
jgi:SAM-dependent methyltransferase